MLASGKDALLEIWIPYQRIHSILLLPRTSRKTLTH